MRKILFVSGPLLILLLAVLYAASAYFFVWSLRGALTAGDASALENLIDFPSVRQSLKDQFSVAFTRQMSAAQDLKNNPFAGLGSIVGPAMIDRLVDSYCTPDMVVAAIKKKVAIQGDSTIGAYQNSLTDASNSDWSEPGNVSFLSFGRFRIVSKDLGLIARLEGLGWKIYRVEISQEFLDQKAKETQQRGMQHPQRHLLNLTLQLTLWNTLQIITATTMRSCLSRQRFKA